MNDAPVSTLPNLGPTTEGWLAEVGITTLADLRALGAVEAYRRLKFSLLRQANLNALYALEAALRDCHWLRLPDAVKAALQAEAKAVDAALRKGMAAHCARI